MLIKACSVPIFYVKIVYLFSNFVLYLTGSYNVSESTDPIKAAADKMALKTMRAATEFLTTERSYGMLIKHILHSLKPGHPP